jgi:hypothetical protein
VTKITLEFVNVISAFTATAGVLAVNRIHGQTTWTHAKNEGILPLVSEKKPTAVERAYLGPDRAVVFCISLDSEVQNSLFMFMLKERKKDNGRC